MTERELEVAVLGFINGELLRDRPPVAPSDRLFEDGHLDSVRVLELIAFIEQQTGRRVPDRQVRLATLRSVRAIARAFCDAPVDDGREAPVHEYHTAPDRFRSPLDELRKRGELRASGELAAVGTAARLVSFFDETFARWGDELGARELPARDMVPVVVLERAGFVESFPQLLVRSADDAAAHAPAACYHVYPALAGATLDGAAIFGVRCTCRRAEAEPRPLERATRFHMREIVTVGARQEVERVRHRLLRRLDRFVTALALDGVVETATDPFFVDAARGRALAQQAGGLKLEVRLTLDDGRRIAVASLNRHLDHFGRAFGISSAAAPAWSGCVAFGLERWVLAFLTQHGFDTERWPPLARHWMHRHGAHAATA